MESDGPKRFKLSRSRPVQRLLLAIGFVLASTSISRAQILCGTSFDDPTGWTFDAPY